MTKTETLTKRQRHIVIILDDHFETAKKLKYPNGYVFCVERTLAEIKNMLNSFFLNTFDLGPDLDILVKYGYLTRQASGSTVHLYTRTEKPLGD